MHSIQFTSEPTCCLKFSLSSQEEEGKNKQKKEMFQVWKPYSNCTQHYLLPLQNLRERPSVLTAQYLCSLKAFNSTSFSEWQVYFVSQLVLADENLSKTTLTPEKHSHNSKQSIKIFPNYLLPYNLKDLSFIEFYILKFSRKRVSHTAYNRQGGKLLRKLFYTNRPT